MQTSSLDNPPLVLSNRPVKDHPESTSSDPEINSKPSQDRWTILFLLCASTFGVNVFSSILLNTQNEIWTTFQVKRMWIQKPTIERITWFIPLIAGLAIYRFGIKAVYRFFMRPCAVGTLLLVASFQVRSYTLYFWGQLLVKGSIHGLWVTQMEMIIKCFKGKELSLAIGIVSSSKVVAGALGNYSYSFVSGNELPLLLCFAIVFCFLGNFALNFMTKIYMTVKEEDERSILEEDVSLNKSTILALFISVLCFRVADLSEIVDMSQIIGSPSSDMGFISYLVSVFSPMILLPLFKFFADRKGGRVIGVFSSFLMLLIENMTCFLLEGSKAALLSSLPLIPLKAGRCLIEASSWSIIGLWTPRKNLGVFLGSTYTFACFLACYYDFWTPGNPMNLCFEFGSVLIVRVGYLVYGWRGGLKKKKLAVAVATRTKL